MSERIKVRVRSLLGNLGFSLTLLLGLSLVSFFLFQAFPGDPARLALGPGASEESVNQLRQEWGLENPLVDQYLNYLGNIIQLDFGTTYLEGRSVSGLVFEKFGTTASIGLRAALLAMLVSYGIQLSTYLVPRVRLLSISVSALVAVPSFVTAILGGLLVVSVFPFVSLSGEGLIAFGMGWWLAVGVLAVNPTALMNRVLQVRIQENRDAVFTVARQAEGFGSLHVFHHCLLRSALVSWLAILVNQLSLLFLATMIVEILFTIPGSGQLLVQAVQRSDFPLIQGILLMNGIFFIGLHFASESLYLLLSPLGHREEAIRL